MGFTYTSSAGAIIVILVLIANSLSLRAQDSHEAEPIIPECAVMTTERMGEIILRLDENALATVSGWQFVVDDVDIRIVYDIEADRMRIIVPIVQIEDLTSDQMIRLMQANFDSTLDARYAVAQGMVRSAYIHPLSILDDREFLSGIGQTANLTLSFGTTYSSGALLYGGGDSQELLQRELIDRLYKKGLPI